MLPVKTGSIARWILGLILVLTVASIPLKSHAALPGDCDGNLSVTIAEVQSAINMFLGLKSVEACVDNSGDSSVSIAEVQKVINSFLGIVPPTMKGFWKGVQGTVGTSLIVLANGEAWVVFQESGINTRFARLQTQTTDTNFSGTGNEYLLKSGTTETASSSGTFTEKSALSGALTTAHDSTSFSLAYDSQYEILASQNDAFGSWVGSYSGGNSSTTINIATGGVLTGSSSTGCSYNGTMQPRNTDPAIFDLNLTETCVVGGSRNLSGIATVNTAKTHLSFAATTSDMTSGALFTGQK